MGISVRAIASVPFLAAIAVAIGTMSVASAAAAGAEPAAGDYVRGVKLWANDCARCHNMRDPKEFRDDQWKVIVTHMKVRAGLTGQDARDMLAFLQGSN
jgi:cytochrome c553